MILAGVAYGYQKAENGLVKCAGKMRPVLWILLGTVIMLVISFSSAILADHFNNLALSGEESGITHFSELADRTEHMPGLDYVEMAVAITAGIMTIVQTGMQIFGNENANLALRFYINKACMILCIFGIFLWGLDAINDVVCLAENANEGAPYIDQLDLSSGLIGLAGLSHEAKMNKKLKGALAQARKDYQIEHSGRTWKQEIDSIEDKEAEELSKTWKSWKSDVTLQERTKQIKKLNDYEHLEGLIADVFLMFLAIVGTIGFAYAPFDQDHWMRFLSFACLSAFAVATLIFTSYKYRGLAIPVGRRIETGYANVSKAGSRPSSKRPGEDGQNSAIELMGLAHEEKSSDDEEVTLSDGSSHSGNETGEDSQNVGRNIAHRRSSMFTQAQAQQLALARAQALINEQKEEAGSEEKSVNEPSRTAQPETSLNLSSRRSQGEPERSRTVLQEEASLNLSSRRSQVHPVPAEETAESSRTREELEEQPASLDSTPANSYDGQSPQRAQQSPGATPDGNTSGTDESHRRLLPIDKLFAEIMA